jgi:hypothetical protein
MDLPLQIGLAIYYLAKLRMLDSYYNFIDKYIDRSVFFLMEIDTGSNYFAFSEDINEKLIKPQMRDEYEKKKKTFYHQKKTTSRSYRAGAGLRLTQRLFLYNNLLAGLARKSNPRARASTGRSRQGHCAPAFPEWDAAGALVYRAPSGR